MRLQVYGDGLIRVTSVTDRASSTCPASLMVDGAAAGERLLGQRGAGQGHADDRQGLRRGRPRQRQRHVPRRRRATSCSPKAAPAGFAPATAEGQQFLAVRQQFNRGTDEGFYGLGQHQNRQMNYNGEDVELAQHNMDIAVPFVVSTRNYGLLWDNNSITRFGDPEPYPFAGGEATG